MIDFILYNLFDPSVQNSFAVLFLFWLNLKSVYVP